jgi:L-lactate dehydrogenase complex protein LldG
VTARELVLERVRRALAGAAASPAPAVSRAYAVGSDEPVETIVEAFVERVRDYRASVVRTDDARRAAEEALAAEGARSVGVAVDLDAALRPTAVAVVEDESLPPERLEELDGALTTCAVACSATGTIGLDGGPGQGRRALTLLPDLHVCVVRAEQIVATVPELVRRLEPAASEGRPIVLVSGPSATSDIELERVEGVHGPRRLVVIVER